MDKMDTVSRVLVQYYNGNKENAAALIRTMSKAQLYHLAQTNMITYDKGLDEFIVKVFEGEFR